MINENLKQIKTFCDLLTCQIKQDNKEINIEFISKIHLDFFQKKKKKTAHAYLSTLFFLSLLARKFATFEQMLLTERIKEKLAHAYF